MTRNVSLPIRLATAMAALLLMTACGSDDEASDAAATEAAEDGTADASTSAGGIRIVSPADGAAILDNPPADLVVLDVRTAEEFAEGHLAGATMLDFYSPDFPEQLAGLDPDVPYVLYCRSGNRSGQTRAMMTELGFTDVADIEGGIVSWLGAGLPIDG